MSRDERHQRAPAGTHGVATTLAALALTTLAACSTTAAPAAPEPDPAMTAPGVYASAERPGSGSDNDFVDGDSDSDVADSPTFTDAELSDQVDRAARQFVTVSLTRGYPDRNDKAHLNRTRQLMTRHAADQLTQRDVARDGPRKAAALYEDRERNLAEVTSVSPTVLGADRATATVEYRLLTQRERGGTWRDVGSTSSQQQTLGLVDKSGEGWLVTSVR